MPQAFDGIRVLELCHVIAAPYASYLLALQGADVIKIEPPKEPDCVRGRGVDGELNADLLGSNYLTQNGNKRALSLDLSTEEGREIVLRLVAEADVLIENYRAGALRALGLGQERLRARNPRLVYCSITGFGQGGARDGVNAYDNIIQAASGLMSETIASDGRPTKTGASIVDYATGMAAAFAIASALHRRQRDGEGVYIDCAMLDTALSLIGTGVTNALMKTDAGSSATVGHKESGLGCYPTADGLIMIGAFNQRQHERMWHALARPDLAAWSNWSDIALHAAEMTEELSRILLTRDAASWEGWFHSIGVPAERVRTVPEGVAIVEAQERAFLQPLPLKDGRSVRVPTAPFTFSEDGPRLMGTAPSPGADNDAILTDLGFDGPAIAELREEGVIG